MKPFNQPPVGPLNRGNGVSVWVVLFLVFALISAIVIMLVAAFALPAYAGIGAVCKTDQPLREHVACVESGISALERIMSGEENLRVPRENVEDIPAFLARLAENSMTETAHLMERIAREYPTDGLPKDRTDYSVAELHAVTLHQEVGALFARAFYLQTATQMLLQQPLPARPAPGRNAPSRREA